MVVLTTEPTDVFGDSEASIYAQNTVLNVSQF